MSNGSHSEDTAQSNNISIVAASMVRGILPTSVAPLMQTKPCEWAAAKDKKSNRTYYYNVKTRETTWDKPVELAASQQEKEYMIRKKKESTAFFRDMENNIKNTISQKLQLQHIQQYQHHQEHQHQIQGYEYQQRQPQHKHSSLTAVTVDPTTNTSYIASCDMDLHRVPGHEISSSNTYNYSG